MAAAVNNVTEQPNIVSAAVDGQAVRGAAVPFACMIRRTPLRMRVADAAAGGVVVSVGKNEYRDLPLPAAAVCCCRCYCSMLLLSLS